jgi:hypothetical protein
MTTYSFVQYDVLNDLIYFKGTPTPGLVDIVNQNKNDISSIGDIVQSDTTGQLNLLPSDAAQDIKDFLTTVPEISLTLSKFITLTIAIIDDVEMGNVDVVSRNLDGTKTYATKGGASLIISIDILKPGKKWPTMAKCRNCLKFTFDEDNEFNFTGNIGGNWDGSFRNGQKVYSVDIPTFPTNASPAVYTNYRIFWKPNVTYSGLDYNGNAINIVNTHKWICVPSSSIGTPSELSNNTFFHVLNNFSASCAYTPPTTTWYNFFGKNGYFLLNNTTLPTQQTNTQDLKCPTFSPTPGTSSYGYNCGPNGCVAAPFGSTGSYATLAQCELSCSITPSASIGYNCTPNGCVQVPLASASYATLAECEIACTTVTVPTSCSCIETNLVTNPNFSSQGANWTYTPTSFTPGVGQWNFSTGLAAATVAVTMSNATSSLISLSQNNILNPSCSYSVCLQAWTFQDNPAANLFFNSGPNFPLNGGVLTSTPTAYNFTVTGTSNLTFYLALAATGSAARVFIDNVCVNLLSCPPLEPGDCTISGSVYTYEEVEYDCLCPLGYYSDGSGSCILSGSTSGQIIIPAPVGIPTASLSNTSLSCASIAFGLGWSILQNPANVNGGYPSFINNSGGVYSPSPNPLEFWQNGKTIPPYPVGQPSLYYQFNSNGTGNASLGNPSPIAGNPNIHKTQYTFDILKAPFWSDPSPTNPSVPFPPGNPAGVSSLTPINPLPTYPWNRWLIQRLRWLPEDPITQGTPPNITWYGCGTAVPTSPTTKTYYLLVAASREFKIKLNGNTLLSTAPFNQGVYNQYFISMANQVMQSTNFPAYSQQYFARLPVNLPMGFNGTSSFPLGTFPAPYYGHNPYITNTISGSWGYMSEGPNMGSYTTNGVAGFPGYNWWAGKNNPVIFPITVPSGSCGVINIEARSGNSCDISGFMGAVLFDNTATQIANATSLNDLNIIWDTAYLPNLRTIPNNITNFPTSSQCWNVINPGDPGTTPVFLYGYVPASEPTPAAYVPTCPPGTTPISGSACNGCTSSIQSLPPEVPCGQCIECTHGRLYNGHVVDKGGFMLQGRGSSGIVNTNLTANNTWVIPAESDWNTLITYLNNGTIPPTTIGSLGTVAGGKMKDYTRDLNATCWENTNIGAQTNVSSSGWVGTAGGKRDNNGAFSGLGFEGIWWSSNSSSAFPNPFQLYTRELKNYSDDVYRNIYTKNYGFSLRLVRPAAANEVDGTVIASAYAGNDGTLYDGIVIGTQVWINKNLSETLYNNGSAISNTINSTAWSTSSISPVKPTSCFYDNNPSNASISTGNVNPLTGECFTFPTYYIYQKCGTDQYLVQTVSGSTTIPGKVQKDIVNDCWSFVETSLGLPNYPNQTLYTTNYFSGSNYVYNNCDECNAIHTIYVKFGTKNC